MQLNWSLSSLHLKDALCQLFTADSSLLPLWDWAGCVYQSLMHCYSFTMTCPVLFFSILGPCLCRGFLHHYTLSYQIWVFFFFLNDYTLAHQALVFVMFQREFLWRCSKCCQRWINRFERSTHSFLCVIKMMNYIVVRLSSARKEKNIRHF